MRIEIIIMIVALSISVMPTAAQPPGDTPHVSIDDGDNQVKYLKFAVGDPWSITMWDTSTGDLRYQFSGTIEDFGNQNPNAFVWFSQVSPGGLTNGIQKCIVTGSYTVHAEGINNGITYTANGYLTVEQNKACEPPISPIPEVGTIVMTSAGILGIFLISKKYRKE